MEIFDSVKLAWWAGGNLQMRSREVLAGVWLHHSPPFPSTWRVMQTFMMGFNTQPEVSRDLGRLNAAL